jgi:diaminopimelate decarboxylase
MLSQGVRELAERLGRQEAALPAYVYDLAGLAAHLAVIRAALPQNVEFCYAVKANPDPAVLRVVARWTDGLEVASGGELAHAADTVPGARLTFGGPGKTQAEIAAAVRAGVFRFHVESPHELRLLGAAALAAGRTADVLLRVNLPPEVPDPGVAPASGVPGASGVSAVSGGSTASGAPGERAASPAAPASGAALVMGGGPAPFGMDPYLLDGSARWLAEGSDEARALRLRGLHAHLASGLEAPALLGSAGRILDFARRWCARHGVRNPEFNLGGGMAVDYRRPGEHFDWAGYGRGLAQAVRPGEILRIEPGRAVTAYCGWYVTRVLDVKPSQGKTYAVVAGGTHHLRTPAAKGHDQPFDVLPVPAWPHDWARPAAPAGAVTIVGQLCTPKDILARDVQVPGLRAGDLVAFGLAGAYAWNISHHGFLMHPEPGFHYLDIAT